jgi:protocatechuate 3,4-dioxygenase beta subunit
MRPLTWLALLLAVCLSVHASPQRAESPGSPVGVDRVPQARVTGRVILGDTHKSARNAVVLLNSLDGQNRQFVRVGLDGTYRFDHVVPGEYIVITYLDGYLSPFDQIKETPADTTIAQLFEKIVAAQGSLKVEAQGTQTFDVTLERGASVSGRVLYSDGTPAIQAGIELQDAAAPGFTPDHPNIQLGDIARSEFVHTSFETDDEGRFRISGIRPGTYRIAAVQLQKEPTQMPDSFLRSIAGALRYYDNNTIHPRLAKVHTLAAGQELHDLEIRIPLEGLYPVQGEVVARDGRRITHAEVTARDTSDPAIWLTAVVNDGLFRFDRLPPGTYSLSARYGNIAPSGQRPGESFGAGETTFTVKDTELNDLRLTLPATPNR